MLVLLLFGSAVFPSFFRWSCFPILLWWMLSSPHCGASPSSSSRPFRVVLFSHPPFDGAASQSFFGVVLLSSPHCATPPSSSPRPFRVVLFGLLLLVVLLSSLFLSVVLLFLLLVFDGADFPPLTLWVVLLPTHPRFRWCSSLLLFERVLLLHPFGWCCLSLPLYPLHFWPPHSRGWCRFFTAFFLAELLPFFACVGLCCRSPVVCGAAFSSWVVMFSPLPFLVGWCCRSPFI